jgi:hypothetical protein
MENAALIGREVLPSEDPEWLIIRETWDVRHKDCPYVFYQTDPNRAWVRIDRPFRRRGETTNAAAARTLMGVK